MQRKVIMFDFDGVIVDSIEISYNINRSMCEDLKFEEWQSWFEGNVFKEIRSNLGREATQDEFFKQYYCGLVNLIPVKGMPEIIDNLSREYELVIISSSSEVAIIDYLKKNNLSEYFKRIMGRDTHQSKVEKIKTIISDYNIDPLETLLITDTLGDIKEANEAGVKSLAVLWGVHSKETLMRANPHFVASGPKDIITGINKLIQNK